MAEANAQAQPGNFVDPYRSYNFRIDRTPQSNTLNFQVTYTAWEE